MKKTKANDGIVHTNILANEYEFPPLVANFKIENHIRFGGQKEAYLNQAEQTAIQQERLCLEEEARKKQLFQENDRKIKENLKKVNQNKRHTELLNELKKQEDRQSQKEKLEKLNKELRSKIIGSYNKNQKDFSQINCSSNNNNLDNDNNDNSRNFYIIEELGGAKDKDSHHKQLSYYIQSERSKNNAALSQKSMHNSAITNKKRISNVVSISKDFETFSFNENEIENEMEKPPQPTEKGNLRLINRELKETESVIDIREDIDLLIKRKLDLVAKNSYLATCQLGTANIVNTNYINSNNSNCNNNIDTDENNLINFNSHQRLNSNFLYNNKSNNNLNVNNLKSIVKNNNINVNFTNSSSICDISSISNNKKNLNSSNNLKNNLIRNIMAKPDDEAGSHNKLNSNSKSNNFNNNQNSFHNFSTNILNSNRINDSALSEFSNDNNNNNNNKLKKTKSSNALVSKNNFITNNSDSKSKSHFNISCKSTKIRGKHTIKPPKDKINLDKNDNQKEKNSEFNYYNTKNRISSANIKNSNAAAFCINNKNSHNFYKITSSTKNKSSINNVKNSLNSKYFSVNTQKTENDDEYNDNNTDNYYASSATTNANNHQHTANLYSNKTNETAIDNTNQNTSCLSDLNIKLILERNIDTVKNFRKTGMTRIPAEQNNILSNNINETSYCSNAVKNSNIHNTNNNTSFISNFNNKNMNMNKNNQVSVRKFDNINISNNTENSFFTSSNIINSKIASKSIISKSKESKSQSKINVNLQKRR